MLARRTVSYYAYYMKTIYGDLGAVELGKREAVERLAVGQPLILQDADRERLAQL